MKKTPKTFTLKQDTKRLLIKYPTHIKIVTTTIDLSISGTPVRLEITLPSERVTAIIMVPLFHSLANFFVNFSVEDAVKDGKTISCQKGCGTCCQQLVPLTILETTYLKNLVSNMPLSKKTAIRKKFLDASKQFHKAKILEKLQKPQRLNKEERVQLAMDYFELKISCPFLEDNSCSIHQHRPIACREYLVTSPIQYCVNPKKGKIEGIEIPRRVSLAVSKMTDKNQQIDGSRHWVPLTVALQYPSKKTKQENLTGIEWLQKLLMQLSS